MERMKKKRIARSFSTLPGGGNNAYHCSRNRPGLSYQLSAFSFFLLKADS